MTSPTTEITETPASPPRDVPSSSEDSSAEHDNAAAAAAAAGAGGVTHHNIHAPVPTRPRLLSRKSSGPMVINRDSDVGPVDIQFGPDDVRAMSPRRASEDIEAMGREARDELRRWVVPLLLPPRLTPFLRVSLVHRLVVGGS